MSRTLKPQESPLVETRLIWMKDNQSNLLMELYQQGTLQQKVLQEVKQANQTYLKLMEQGVPKMEAQEIRLHILAPAEGMADLPEKQLISDKIFNRIVREVMR